MEMGDVSRCFSKVVLSSFDVTLLIFVPDLMLTEIAKLMISG